MFDQPTAHAGDAAGGDASLPRWDVSDLFDGLDDRRLVDVLEGITAGMTRLEAQFDELAIRGTTDASMTGGDGDRAAAAINGFNDALERFNRVRGFLYATVTTDSTNERAQALFGQLMQASARVAPLQSRLAEWVAAKGADAVARSHPVAAEHAGPLRQLAERATHQMPETDEHLYAEMRVTGSGAWSRLHSDVTSQLAATVELPDGRQQMPIAAVRGLASHPDEAVRHAAYQAELDAWPTVGVVAAAAMNSIKGEANGVNKRRGWGSALDASLFANSVSRPTFDAMQRAIVAALPDFRRWMRAKARLHGSRDGLAWWDLVAPVPGADRQMSWDDGFDLIRQSFATFTPQLAQLADRAIEQRWIDAAPRSGKVGGAFCMSVEHDRSLILLNWSGSLSCASTTAHELGHAYHNVQLAGRTPLQRALPMALAETASIFCETLVMEDGLAGLHGAERLPLLDAHLQNAAQVVVDIHSRFLFESEVFARRAQRTLGVSEMNDMMRAAQGEAYGDGLDQSTAHPYMWIVKSHYYGSHFYNWPYTYGLLFGLGLFARYREDPERFRAGYDEMLSRVGMDTAEDLAASFGFNVTDEAFWTASLDVLRAEIDDYVALVAAPGTLRSPASPLSPGSSEPSPAAEIAARGTAGAAGTATNPAAQ